MFELDLRSRLPIYEQLVEKFKDLIIKGVLKGDEKLPSVRALASDLTINPNTIQKAYRELERQGYIYSIKGKGSFVNGDKHAINPLEMKNIKNEIEKSISQAIYFGISKEEIIKLISEIYDKNKGGK